MIELFTLAMMVIKLLEWTRSLVIPTDNGMGFNRHVRKQHPVLNPDIIAEHHQKCLMQNITEQKNK